MPELSQDQQDKLASFKEITQYADEDHDKMVKLLVNCQWQLEAAISRFFEGNFEFPDLQTGPHVEQGRTEDTGGQPRDSRGLNPSLEGSFMGSSGRRSSFNQLDDFALGQYDLLPKFPKANKIPGTWKLTPGIASDSSSTNTSPLLFLLLLIPRSVLFVVLKLVQILGYILPINGFFSHSSSAMPAQPKYSGLVENIKSTEKGDDVDNKFNFKTFVESTLKDPSDLPIFEGEFNDAYDVTKADLKFLLVILLNSEDKDNSEKFIKYVVNSPEFKDLVNDEYAGRGDNFLIWGADVQSLEGWHVGRQYKVQNLPFMGLISNVSTYGETFPTMSYMKYSQNFAVSASSPEERILLMKSRSKKVIKSLKKSVNQYAIQLIDQQIDRESKNYERLIKQQQDEAYWQSLEKDRLKKQEKEKKIEEENKRKQEVLDDLVKSENQVQYIKSMLLKWEKSLVSDDRQNDPINQLTGAVMKEKDEYTVLQFKVPSGERFVKKLNRAHVMRDVYLFAFLKLIILELVKQKIFEDNNSIFEWLKETLDDEQEPSDLEFNFELHSAFPKFTVPETEDIVGENKNLVPNCSLLIEYDPDYEEQLSFVIENFKESKKYAKMTIDDIILEEEEEEED